MSLEEHLAALLGQVQPLEPLDITLTEAIGCQLAEAVLTPTPVPHFDRCTIAGYAVRSADLASGSAACKVVDEVQPGFVASQPVYGGAAIKVEAGAMLPAGADAVVWGPAGRVGGHVTLTGPVSPGAGVAAVGSVAAAGTPLLAAGAILDSSGVGLLAGVGLVRVSVRPRPRVVVITTGDDLMPLGSQPTAGLVPDATGPLLTAAAQAAGADGFRVGPVPTEHGAIGQAVDDQLIRADLVVVTGSLAVGSPLRRQVAALGEISYDEDSTNLGPFGHGRVGDDAIPLLALPGDPAAAALLFTVLAVPMIAAMRGVRPPAPLQLSLRDSVARRAVTQLLPARITDAGVVATSVELLALTGADAVIRILPGTGDQAAGSTVLGMALRPGGR